jgi:large subunit ribosomal protein L6
VKITVEGGTMSVQGPKGRLQKPVAPGIQIKVEADKALVTRPDNERSSRAKQGLVRALLNNMVRGVHQGFQRALDISGVGYRAEVKGKVLVLYLGYSHPVEYKFPESIEIAVEKTTKVIVRGPDKETVGATAAKIRGFRRPDPYKAKGITYEGEVIKRKAGKKAVGTGT